MWASPASCLARSPTDRSRRTMTSFKGLPPSWSWFPSNRSHQKNFAMAKTEPCQWIFSSFLSNFELFEKQGPAPSHRRWWHGDLVLPSQNRSAMDGSAAKGVTNGCGSMPITLGWRLADVFVLHLEAGVSTKGSIICFVPFHAKSTNRQQAVLRYWLLNVESNLVA